VPVLEFNEPDLDLVSKSWNLVVDDFPRPQEQRWPSIMNRLRLWNGKHHLVRDKVGVRTPRSDENLALVVLAGERLRTGDLRLNTG